MADDSVHYVVTEIIDGRLIVKFTLDTRSIVASLLWDGTSNVDEFLRQHAGQAGMVLKRELATPDLSGVVGHSGLVPIYTPPPPVVVTPQPTIPSTGIPPVIVPPPMAGTPPGFVKT